jgi:hypothetical protein
MFTGIKIVFSHFPVLFTTSLLVLSCIVSCKPVSVISIDVLEPAEVTIPPYIETIGFVNRSYPPWMAKDSSDIARRPVEDLFIIDTIINNKLFLGLNDALNISPLFDLGKQQVYMLRRNDSIRFPEPLNEQKIIYICDTTSFTDCLISLEGYIVSDTLYHYFNYDYYLYEVVYMLSGKILWRIYDGVYGMVLDEFYINDTIEWSVRNDSYEEGIWELPEAVDAYREYAYQAGYKYGGRISPEWYQVKRFYYRTGNRNMMKAAKLADNGQWEEALRLWKSCSESENEMIAARASFNVALYFEMNDRIIPAIDWATKAYDQDQNEYAKQYIEILEQRKLNKLKLQQQMPAEEIL